MIPRDVKSPTAPIPFHKLLRIVAIVDRDDEQTKPLFQERVDGCVKFHTYVVRE